MSNPRCTPSILTSRCIWGDILTNCDFAFFVSAMASVYNATRVSRVCQYLFSGAPLPP